MPYRLVKAGFRTIPDDDDTRFSTLIYIEDEGTDEECIAFEGGGQTVRIDFDEWPLIVEAVEKLLGKTAPLPVEGIVSKEFLDKIRLDPDYAQAVVKGDFSRLIRAFAWEDTPQDHGYWEAIYNGLKPLTKTDKDLVQTWLDAYEYYQRKDNV
jgi:hypothetical protein